MIAPLRARALALGVDYLVILAWLGLLAAVGVPLALLHPPHPERWPPAVLDLTSFALTVLPVGLYLAVTEAGPRSATWGKRRFGLVVTGPGGARPGVARILVRTVVKLLPWELAHLAVIRLALQSGSLVLAWTADLLSLVLVVLSVVLAVVGRRHRALHDLVAGTVLLSPSATAG